MTLIAITAAVMCCLFIGVQATVGIAALLIIIGLATQFPILLVVLAIAVIAALLTKKK